jgi:hypothetical protein
VLGWVWTPGGRLQSGEGESKTIVRRVRYSDTHPCNTSFKGRRGYCEVGLWFQPGEQGAVGAGLSAQLRLVDAGRAVAPPLYPTLPPTRRAKRTESKTFVLEGGGCFFWQANQCGIKRRQTELMWQVPTMCVWASAPLPGLRGATRAAELTFGNMKNCLSAGTLN